MTNIILDDKEYDSADLTEEQNAIINLLTLGNNSVILLNHMLQCTQLVQNMKTAELKKSLEDNPEDSSEDNLDGE
tara:strand:- start:259 stop:483 length:225 start_codon:yes stop_codon:yes gene_type:complete